MPHPETAGADTRLWSYPSDLEERSLYLLLSRWKDVRAGWAR